MNCLLMIVEFVVFMMFLTVTGLKTNELSPDDVEFVVYMMFLFQV